MDKQIRRGSSQLMKKINRNTTLNLIRNRSPISGAGICSLTRMRASTVSNIINWLKKKNLITRIGTGSSSSKGGRRPVLWEINPRSGYAIGLEVGVNGIKALVTDLASQIRSETALEITPGGTEEILTGKVILAIRKIKKTVPVRKIKGIGIGIAGIVDNDNGIVIESHLFKKNNVHLKENLEKEFKVPVLVDNDANLAAFGEKWMGIGQEYDNLVYVTVNQNPDEKTLGIGTGLIVHGDVYRGGSKSAGELDTRIRTYDENSSQRSFKEIVEMSKKGDTLASKTLKRLGEEVASQIVMIVNFFNPELIVLGGDIVFAGQIILDIIKSEIKRKALRAPASRVRIVFSSFNDKSVALGGASLVLSDVFNLVP